LLTDGNLNNCRLSGNMKKQYSDISVSLICFNYFVYDLSVLSGDWRAVFYAAFPGYDVNAVPVDKYCIVFQ
jgi:hypothetical protein